MNEYIMGFIRAAIHALYHDLIFYETRYQMT